MIYFRRFWVSNNRKLFISSWTSWCHENTRWNRRAEEMNCYIISCIGIFEYCISPLLHVLACCINVIIALGLGRLFWYCQAHVFCNEWSHIAIVYSLLKPGTFSVGRWEHKDFLNKIYILCTWIPLAFNKLCWFLTVALQILPPRRYGSESKARYYWLSGYDCLGCPDNNACRQQDGVDRTDGLCT